jgi:hypothetical protein
MLHIKLPEAGDVGTLLQILVQFRNVSTVDLAKSKITVIITLFDAYLQNCYKEAKCDKGILLDFEIFIYNIYNHCLT